MPTPVLICDDASFARKQMARALPPGWDVDVSFAAHGGEAIEAIKAGKGDILFLDLNMPVMDGYEVLQAIRAQDLSTMVIVVSGDIQPEAQARVTKLGAMAFLKKPVTAEQIEAVLQQYGIQYATAAAPAKPQTGHPWPAALASVQSAKPPVEVQVNILDGYQEVANVAMGHAADFLARLLKAFVVMPIPKVNMIEMGELKMTLGSLGQGEAVSAVCQGFIGKGISGEALLIFNESSLKDIAELMNYGSKVDSALEVELLMDVSNVLIGACLKGIADQLDIDFSQGQPLVLGRHVHVGDLLQGAAGRWTQTLAIEMGCRIEHRQVSCDLLLLFTEDSLAFMNERVSCLID